MGITGRAARHSEPLGCHRPGGSEKASLETSSGAPAWRPGRRAGELPRASGLRCCPGRARRGSAGVRLPPGCGCGSGPGPGARRNPHGRGTSAAAGPGPARVLRGGGGETGRPGTGRPGLDPEAGPAGLGGLGRPLPLQPSEMAEHVAIMPRHSGCPARPALISGPRTPLLSPSAPRKGNKTQHVSAAPAHKAPGLGLSGGQSGPSISAPGPLCPSPPCHTFCSRIQ